MTREQPMLRVSTLPDPMSIQAPIIDEHYVAKNRLIIGNLHSPVALCALWKDLTKVTFSAEQLARISVIGNLYTARGISRMIRTLWRFPSIRHIILWGPDTQHTGRMLLNLWKDGLSNDHSIAGEEFRLDLALPAEAIDHLREHVKIHDQRTRRNYLQVAKMIETLEYYEPHAAPRLYEEPKSETADVFPSSGSGWHVNALTVGEGWPRLLDLVMRFGIIKHSQYEIPQRELLNVMTVITHESDDNFRLPPYLPVSEQGLAEYLPRIVENMPADDLSYTYGNRLRGYFETDQIQMMTDALRRAPHTRRAIATLWDPRSDPARETPPCLTQVVMNIVNDKLCLTYSARSQDIYGAWPQNTLGMRTLQTQVARKLGIKTGSITSHTVSAHIYEHDWVQSRQTAEAQRGAVQKLEFDPQGNFTIRVEDTQIIVELISPDGQAKLWETHGTSSSKIGNEIASLRLASLPEHYVYLGRELQRAEQALRQGADYDQGRA